MKRRKALIILGFETPDYALSRVHRGWNKYFEGKKPPIQATRSSDFLIVRDKQNKRPGFLELELKSGETPMQGLRRVNPRSASAVTAPWQEVDVFPYTENNNHWEVLVGLVNVHADQRQVDLYDQTDELPFLLEWQTPAWLFRQNEEDFLNHLTSVAISRPKVRAFLTATQRRQVA